MTMDEVDEDTMRTKTVFFSRRKRNNNQCCRNIADAFPRSTTIFCRIFLPLNILVWSAALLGYFLALAEKGEEFDQNDATLRRQFWLEALSLRETVQTIVAGAPLFCFQKWQNMTNATTSNAQTNHTGNSVRDAILETSAAWANWSDSTLSDPELEWISDLMNSMESSFQTLSDDEQIAVDPNNQFVDSLAYDYLQTCGETLANITVQLVDISNSMQEQYESDLTFHWIRCWNDSGLTNIFPYRATPAFLEAAQNQSNFYRDAWEADRQRLLEEYYFDMLEDDSRNRTDYLSAWARASQEATGRQECSINVPASAWFWFTVMTTVGYGNQAPVSLEGRRLTMGLGLLSILAFGAILATSGTVVNLLFDDILSRTRMSRWLTQPHVATLLWGTVAICWMYLLGLRVDRWWTNRLDLDISTSESFWFGFISSTTVGLGDYFLQPEVMFMQDVVWFSLLYLTGFVFTSTFLSRLGELLSRTTGPWEETLKQRLARTRVLSCCFCFTPPVSSSPTTNGTSKKEIPESTSGPTNPPELITLSEWKESMKHLLLKNEIETIPQHHPMFDPVDSDASTLQMGNGRHTNKYYMVDDDTDILDNDDSTNDKDEVDPSSSPQLQALCAEILQGTQYVLTVSTRSAATNTTSTGNGEDEDVDENNINNPEEAEEPEQLRNSIASQRTAVEQDQMEQATNAAA